jgi:hypothetical protein
MILGKKLTNLGLRIMKTLMDLMNKSVAFRLISELAQGV